MVVRSLGRLFVVVYIISDVPSFHKIESFFFHRFNSYNLP